MALNPRPVPIGFIRLMVHFDALRLDWRRYARAMWWRLCGKRLRSRLMLAPLLGRSRWAYRLWLARQDDAADAATATFASDETLIALVASGEGADGSCASAAQQQIAHCYQITDGSTELSDIAVRHPDSWAIVMTGGDILAEGAATAYRGAIERASPETHVIYADDDLLDADGQRCKPHFKPDWNSELYRHFDYLTGAAIVRLRDCDFLGLPESGWEAQLVAAAAKASAQGGGHIVHLQDILHHRRSRPQPRTPDSVPGSTVGEKLPTISVLVPTRNGLSLLRTCLEGLARTSYAGAMEVIVIDNGSDDAETCDYLASLDPSFATVLRDDGPFNFAAINNRAVGEATGEVLCFLNDDIEIGDPDWLQIMTRQAMREDVGAVGARLLYPDGRIQHAGVVLGIGGGAGHAHRLLDPGEEGYFHRHSLPQFVSAVTAACIVVRRDRFLAVGGFDAQRFAVSFNDVDLCMKLNAKGWHTLYEPRATLVHHESVSRGFDKDAAGAARLAGELAALQKRWSIGSQGCDHAAAAPNVDPYHHPSLSPFSEQFVMRL